MNRKFLLVVYLFISITIMVPGCAFAPHGHQKVGFRITTKEQKIYFSDNMVRERKWSKNKFSNKLQFISALDNKEMVFDMADISNIESLTGDEYASALYNYLRK